MRHLFSLAVVALLAAPALAAPLAQDPPKKEDKHPKLEHLNTSKKGLMLEGFDPVAYFPEGGGKPKKGTEKIKVTQRGVTYYFASEANKETFLANPERFEPQYGGWCAWALADGEGEKVDPDPKSFTLEEGKLFLFYDGFWGDTRKKWNEAGGAGKLAGKGDTNWARITKPKDED